MLITRRRCDTNALIDVSAKVMQNMHACEEPTSVLQQLCVSLLRNDRAHYGECQRRIVCRNPKINTAFRKEKLTLSRPLYPCPTPKLYNPN